jgi:hypothetical protein
MLRRDQGERSVNLLGAAFHQHGRSALGTIQAPGADDGYGGACQYLQRLLSVTTLPKNGIRQTVCT